MYDYNALIINVVDGDTYDAVVDLGFDINFKMRIRLAEVDTYETRLIKGTTEEGKKIGLKAKEFVQNLLLHKKVRLKSFKTKTGKYGRYLFHVSYLDGGSWIDLGKTLISSGFVKLRNWD